MVERVVVDTDVISFLFKGHSRATAYAADLAGKITDVGTEGRSRQMLSPMFFVFRISSQL